MTATDDVADAKLILRGSHSGEIREAVGAPFETTGTGIAVDLGNLAAGEQRRVIVAFELDRESMHFNAETSYQDLHQPGRPAVISASSRHSASRGMKSAEVYKNVRLAYSEQAIDTVEQYIEDKNYDQALAWVEDAYTTNVDVGMAMRISSKLSGPQDELAALRDEVEELRRPKKVRRPKKKAPQIIMTFGDRDS